MARREKHISENDSDDIIVKCQHCKGKGTNHVGNGYNPCCLRAAGLTSRDISSGSTAVCCSCGGAGVVRR